MSGPCVFFDELSKRHFLKRFCHNACICMVCLYHVFACVESNCIVGQIVFHIAGMCKVASHCESTCACVDLKF